MKQTINQYQFEDAFRSAGRQDQFSHAGLNALFDYLEEYEDSCGEEIELDAIALCCEYSEHKSALDAVADYSFEVDGESEQSALAYLRENTNVIEFEGGIIIQNF
jgi:hypothetical protein